MSTTGTITRRVAIQQGVAAAAALSLHAATKPPTKSAAKPNILFLVVDDLRPELNCYGHAWIHSPHIDSIAKAGMQFNHAYVQQAVCSPSRSSLLTGTRPDTTKVWDLKTPFRKALPNVATLPEHFKNNGYFAQGMGKIFHPGLEDPQSFSVDWWTANNAPVYANVYHQDLSGHNHDDDVARETGKNGPAFESADVPDNFYRDGQVADYAVAQLGKAASQGKPFFFAVGFAKPHLPFVAPKRYWDLYDPAKIELAPNPYHPHNAPDYSVLGTSEMRQYDGIPKEGPVPDDLARQLKHGYYAAVSYTDAQIGRVLAELDRLKLRENTIIVLWGDHGWKLGEHGEWTKHTNMENDTNAPMMISVPGMKNAGVQCNALVEFVDLYPTLCELAGLALPPQLEGHSMKPLLDNPKQPWKLAAVSQYPRFHGPRALMGYSLRTADHRFTIWVKDADHSQVDSIELYDHTTDPQENENVAGRKENAELVRQLTELWRQGWKANLPGAKSPATGSIVAEKWETEAVSA